MKTPSFSIIIPTYNSATKIGSALDSVLFQDFNNFEVILIDGLSADNTVSILESYLNKDKRTHFISEKDNGIYDAMNKGIDGAKGEWLYFMGSDDELFDRGVLQAVADAAIGTACTVIYGNAQIIGNTSWARDGDIYDGPFDWKKLSKKNICHQSIFYNTKFIREAVGYFNLAYPLCADWDFNLRCMSKTTFHYINQTIAKFHAGGISTDNYMDAQFSKDFLKNFLSYFKLSVFDPRINNIHFSHYEELLLLQRKQNYLKYATGKFIRKLF